MRSPTTFLGAVALLGATALAWHFKTPAQLEAAIPKSMFTLVAFVDPELPRCKTLEAEWSTVLDSYTHALPEPRPGPDDGYEEKEEDSTYHTSSIFVIDCTNFGPTCQEQYGVYSYPAIRLYFPDGTYERYRGQRKAAEILPYLKRILRLRLGSPPSSIPDTDPENNANANYPSNSGLPPYITLLTESTSPAFLTSDTITILSDFLPPSFVPPPLSFSSSSSPSSAEEEEPQKNKPNPSISRTIHASLSSLYIALAAEYHPLYSFALLPLPDYPSGLACRNNPDDQQYSLSASEVESDPLSMEHFLKKCATPLVPVLSRRNELDYLKPGKSLLYHFLPTLSSPPSCPSSSSILSPAESYRNLIRPLAKRYREYINFVIVDASEYPEMLPVLGLEPFKYPNPGIVLADAASESESGAPDSKQIPGFRMALQNPANGQVFPFGGGDQEGAELTLKAVDQFVSDIAAGKLKPWDGPRKEQMVGKAGKKIADEGKKQEAKHDEL
ncbi:protein disulfide isomerase [Zalerion maritima]|uniref:Protein disulfide isomerase n=1 Tax=Zalerion maritima TaxID=339359 RepID=A0AAD5RP14_9PEZI|nr:protein disulfide isomerase [Zalerion maritima]